MIQMRVGLIKPPRTLFVLTTCFLDGTLLDETIYLIAQIQQIKDLVTLEVKAHATAWCFFETDPNKY